MNHPVMMKMEKRIRIWTKASGSIEAMITAENPKTAEVIWAALPIKGNANRWGDEIYFPISAEIGEENARDGVEVGSVGYWPPGKALCIFFGPTPVSRHGEPRAASPVNVFGEIVGDATAFRRVRDNEEISLERHQI